MTVVQLLDKSKIRRSFATAAHSYDGFAGLQRQIGLELLTKFSPEIRHSTMLDIGCGTGFLTRQLADQYPSETMLALDIALPMLQMSRHKHPDMSVQYLCADAENLPFATGSIGQIYSNLALQWLTDLPDFFTDCKRVLQADGRLVFATFGPETLWELKAAWAAVDGYTHVNSFYDSGLIKEFLQQAGFQIICVDSVLYRYRYPSVMALMHELKGIGAHNVSLTRKCRPTTKSQLQSMIDHYQGQAEGQGVCASYEIIFMQAQG